MKKNLLDQIIPSIEILYNIEEQKKASVGYWFVLFFNRRVPLISAKVVRNVLEQLAEGQNVDEYKSIQNNQSMSDHHRMNNFHALIY